MSKDKNKGLMETVQDMDPLLPKNWTKPEDCPMHAEFEGGHVPMDEPPGITETCYKRWKELGGQVKTKPVEQEKPKRRGLDPELQAMAKIDAILADFDDDQQRRILKWIGSRYQEIITGIAGRRVQEAVDFAKTFIPEQ